MVIYRFCADVVVVLHAMWVLFVVLGLLVVWIGAVRRWRWVRNFWFRVIHFFMIAIVALEALWGIVCPLTSLEQWLRRQAGEAEYTGSFVGKWVNELLFFDLPPWVFTVSYSAFALVVLLTLVLIPPRRPGRFGADLEGSPG